jgi:hypothetical protein
MIIIPLEGSEAKEILIQLNGVKYRMLFQYNEIQQIWTVNIVRDNDKFILILGLPLVLGQELLEPYNFGAGQLLVVDLLEKGSEARFDSFPGQNLLLWESNV